MSPYSAARPWAEQAAGASGVAPEICRELNDFTGRGWLFDELDAWVESEERALYIAGAPGSGKSLFIADLVARRSAASNHPSLKALISWHFCRADDNQSILPKRVISSMAAHLTTLPGYCDALSDIEPTVSLTIAPVANIGYMEAGAVINIADVSLIEGSAERLFDRLITTPLQRLAADGSLPRRLVIAIDGLDEALKLSTDGEQLINLLCELTTQPGSLPDGTKLLLTGRPDHRITSRLRGQSLNLSADARSAADLHAYALQRLTSAAEQRDAEFLADRITQSAAGVFLYARYVLDDLLADRATLMQVDIPAIRLPESLTDYYATSLNRELTRNSERWDDSYRPILGALAVARRPGLTPAELAGVTGLAQSRVDDALKRCTPFLEGSSDSSRRLFHRSFTDYLCMDDAHNIYPQEAHRAVGRFLRTVHSERALRDVVWHLAEGNDLVALDETLTATHLRELEVRFDGPTVVTNLGLAADSAERSNDLLRTLRWTWTSVIHRAHLTEQLSPEYLPVLVNSGQLDRAVKIATELPPSEGAEETVSELAVLLVESGQVGRALDFVEKAHLPWGRSGSWVAVAESLARVDPNSALRLVDEHPNVARDPRFCAALAAAGGEFISAATEFAGSDLEALGAVARAVAPTDLARAFALTDGIRGRYERAAGEKVWRDGASVRGDIVADIAAEDPQRGANVLQELTAAGRLCDENATRAALATALYLGARDAASTLGLQQHLERYGHGESTARGLIIAAAATNDTLAASTLPEWQCHCSMINHKHDADLLWGLPIARLHATAESREIAGVVLTHALNTVGDRREEFEFPGRGIGTLVAALAAVRPDAARDWLDRLLSARGGSSAHDRDQARLLIIPALAAVAAETAYSLAEECETPLKHDALLALIRVIAGENVHEALRIVDQIPARFSATRSQLVGACARHVASNDTTTFSEIVARLPRVGESAAFHVPFAQAGVALASKLASTQPELAQQVLLLCRAELDSSPELRDPYIAAQSLQLAKTDPGGGLQLARTLSSEQRRERGVLAVLGARSFPPAIVLDAIYTDVFPERLVLRSEGRRTLRQVISDLANADLGAAIAVCVYLDDSGLLAGLADHLRTLATARWGDGAVRELVGAVLGAQVARSENRLFVVRRCIATLFDESPPAEASLVLDQLVLEPDLWRELEPWALAQIDPQAALDLWERRGRAHMRHEIIGRAVYLGLEASVAVYLDSDTQHGARDALCSALRRTARSEPELMVTAGESLLLSTDLRQEEVYTAIVEEVADTHPTLAIALVARIVDPVHRARIIEYLASCSSIVNPLTCPNGVGMLLDYAEELKTAGGWYQDAPRRAFEAISEALANQEKPITALIVRTLRSVAADIGTFHSCLPQLIAASYSAQPSAAQALVGEMDTVRTLALGIG